MHSSEDHNYTEVQEEFHRRAPKDMCIVVPKASRLSSSKEQFNQVRDIDELKKITPKVKLVSRDANTLAEFTKKKLALEQTKHELKKYCRTCAGLKLPLVDIFGEKGIQMRLSQQIKHLEEINEYDSLSTQMCMDCICDLKMSYKFFMQIKKAEVKLKSIHLTLSESAAKKDVLKEAKESVAKEVQKEKETILKKKEVEEETSENLDENSEMFEEVIIQQPSDYESIEEFDPDDPPFQPDSSEQDSEEDQPPAKKRSVEKKEVEVKDTAQPKTVFIGGNCHSGGNSYGKVEQPKVGNTVKESKQPNILKRRLLMPPVKKEPPENSEESKSGLEKELKELKVQKLDLNNPLNINNSQEDGIMYVTVKGSKPNELLLVKVKKMEKPIMEKKDEKVPVKKNVELMPIEKIFKRYETAKEKELFTEKVRKPDKREQIIEEQIEEYKKKREKILGAQTNGTLGLKAEESHSRFLRRNNSQDSSKSSSSTENISIKIEATSEDNDESFTLKCEEKDESDTDPSKERTSSEKSYTNTEEYLSRLSRLKLKWEEAKKKKESLQKELDESYTEGNLEKLARILGEKEKNLQDFQDYLKQRRIVITRLKDEDIISLYEDRNNSLQKSKLPDLIDETQPADYIPEERYLECDYCPQTFSSKETLEEHLKSHDYKLLHFCEDCNEEFSTNKAKRNHYIVCIKKLICRYCDLMLETKGKKRQHEQKHCDSMFGQLCDVCGEKFKHQGTLDQHIKTQHMSWEKIFQCPKCPKKFAFKQKLSFHLKSVHTTLRAYLCEDCGADFKNPASLRHHRIRKHQPVGNKRECPVCHKLVPFYSLSKHMHTHKAYTIQCPHCDKMFKNSSTLKQHVRIHEDQRQYRCDTCGVGFNRRDGLRLHMRVHEKTDSRGLKECSCQVCGEKFPNHSTLVIHRNRVHKDGRQYTCHICNRSMISTRSLEWHMSHIHNESLPGIIKEEGDGTPEKKRVSCYHCNKTFKTEMILRTHIKNTHMEKDPMKCLDCEMTFTSEVRLRHHMMVTHNRLEGTLPCPHCPKRFVNQLRLKTHMISHSEERPYTCEICGFNLKTKIQLIKHHQNRHSDERPLQCRYCPWRCKQVSALVCHERTHTNERPYSCSVCRQRFKYLGDKNKHERRHESLGGSGFKRIVPGRNIKPKVREDSGSDGGSEQDTEERNDEMKEEPEEQESQEFTGEEIVKFEEQEMQEEYDQEYEETSREASDAAEVIMNMEDTTVYTEEVTADNIESAEIMADDDMISNEILQSGTVVHLQQEDDNGKIQVIPVMLSLPDLSDTNSEVNLATASIMYNVLKKNTEPNLQNF